MTSDPFQNDLVDLADHHWDQRFERFDRVMAPVIETQAQLGRTVMTIASGALVFSISVAQFLNDRLATDAAHWLLPTSWLLFALTLLLGIGRQVAGARAIALRLAAEGARYELHGQVDGLDLEPDTYGRFATLFGEQLRGTMAPIERVWHWHDRLGVAMLSSLLLGFVALLTLAWVNQR